MNLSRKTKDKIANINWTLISLITIMACFGFVVLYSAAEGNFSPWASKQIIRFVGLIPIMIIIAVIDIKFWLKMAYPIYGIVLLLLIFTEFFGVTAMGATRWIDIGPVNIQPSELMKIAIVFGLAKYFHNISLVNVHSISYLIVPVLMVIVPVGLIIKQPDLGTGLIVLMVGGAIFFVAGVRLWKFAVVIALGVAAMPLVWARMHDYQKARITAFLDPAHDPRGNGYNILQSKIAIGSGGMTGKGFLSGTQSQLSFLPEKQTDFIFTMLSEEFGFFGGVSVILLYALILSLCISISLSSKNHFGRMLGFGITTIIFLHVFINIGMVMGMLPVVGAPLPLLSYGGTIMMVMLTGVGLILNVDLHGDKYLEKSTKFM